MSVHGFFVYSTMAMTLIFGAVATPALAGDDVGQLLANGGAVGSASLADQRGGATPSIDQSAVAIVTGDTANFAHTGSNIFGGFGSSQGMFTVLQNTGNNVAMQSETVLNVNLH